MMSPIQTPGGLAQLADYMILDTPPEPAFDDIVQLASQLCGTEMSSVTLIDKDRQWFKAETGLGVPETPLDQSVCRWGLGRDDLLIIPDMQADPRSADVGAVASGDLRFYAGAPLIAPHGDVLGMLCVFDPDPRPQGLTTDQQAALARLARQVIAQMELRRERLRKLEADAERRQLNEQLTERLNQTLAMIQGLASQTLRAVDSRGPVESFENRLVALTEAHDMLQRKSWADADMMTVVQKAMMRHAAPNRFSLRGPEVKLGPKGAITTSMLLHELASNAVKYGGLSVDGGHVFIQWRLDGEGEDTALTLQWAERGGPPAIAPQRRSFGGKLIAMGLGGGGAVNEVFGHEGYGAAFQAPLSHLLMD